MIDRPATDLDVLLAAIARSQIVVAASVRSQWRALPAGFDDVDVAVLDWIATEARRASRNLVRM